MSRMVGFVIPQFEDEAAQERWWNKIRHAAGRYDAWCSRWLRKDAIKRKRARRKHRVAQRRKRRGMA
jgi:hypothetical protein